MPSFFESPLRAFAAMPVGSAPRAGITIFLPGCTVSGVVTNIEQYHAQARAELEGNIEYEILQVEGTLAETTAAGHRTDPVQEYVHDVMLLVEATILLPNGQRMFAKEFRVRIDAITGWIEGQMVFSDQ